MGYIKFVSTSWIMLAVSGLLVSPIARAGESTAQPAHVGLRITDVALNSNGLLHGQIDVEAENGHEQVHVLRNGELISTIETAVDGSFVVPLSQGGTYHFRSQSGAATVRVWTNEAAPPNTPNSIELGPEPVIRGQTLPPYTQINPWVIGGVVAAAIAIPIVIHNNRSERGNGS